MADGIISREDARAQGLTHFLTGHPCPSGHHATRFVSTGQCSDCLRDWKRQWREANRASFNERARKRRAAAPERARALTKNWQATAQGRAVKARLQRERRARAKGSGGNHTAEDIQAILTAQGGRCAYCGTDIRAAYEVDHITPLKRGGSNGRRNIQIVCGPCNRQKQAKDPIRYAQEIGRLL